MGMRYANGIGVEADKARAVEYWHKAADQGRRGAQYNLGLSYNLDRGVAADPVAAAIGTAWLLTRAWPGPRPIWG